MKQKEKQLLLVDLSARLPYGVKCSDNRHGDSVITRIDIEDKTVYCFDFDEYVLIEHIKPYLRSMSSMTEDEKKIYKTLLSERKLYGGLGIKIIDWLNAHHFDYRGLIPMGLAYEAPEGMYKNNIK